MHNLIKLIKYTFTLGVFYLFILQNPAQCAIFEDDFSDANYQKQIMQTGFRILNANDIEKRITFFYKNKQKPKLKSQDWPKRVTVTKGMLTYADDENELAALLSMKIAYLTDVHKGLFKKTAISYNPRKYEVKSDKKAVDLMVNAGYDPVALITILNKTTKEPCWYAPYILTHKGSERIMYIYQYIYEKYPVYLADNAYLTDNDYQNFLTTTQKDRKRVRRFREERIKIREKKKQTL